MNIYQNIALSISFTGLAVLGTSFLLVAYHLWRVDSNRYSQIRNLFIDTEKKGLSRLLTGLGHSINGTIVDNAAHGKYHLITAGLSKSKSHGIKPQAKLSDEAIRSLIEPTK